MVDEGEVPGADGRSPLGRLLRPRSVAIVGASDRPGALGGAVLANLRRQGFAGAIHLVNPGQSEIGGRACVPHVDDLPFGIDVAVLAIPRAGVVDAVRGLAARRCGAVVVFSAGFAEAGPAGAADQREIADIAAAAGMVLVGPNCLGLVNFVGRVSLTFVDLPEATATGPRRLAILSQSGALAAVLATSLIGRQVPLACAVSTGNEAASGVEDWLEHLAGDPAVAVVSMMAEQLRAPARFLAAARAAYAAGQRIVLLHPGRSAAGAASAATHTGALAGDHAIMRAHVAAAGVVLVETLEELGDVAELLLRLPGAHARAVAVAVESGALKAMLLDQAEAAGLALPPLDDANSPDLRAAVPPFVPVANPIDLTAQGLVDPGLYGRVIAALAADPRVDTLLLALIQTTAHTAGVKIGAVLDAVAAGCDKPLLVAGVDEGGGVDPADVAALHAAGLMYLPTCERALRALAAVARATVPAVVGPGTALAHPMPPLPAGRALPEYRAKPWLAAWGLPVAGGVLVRDAAGAVAAAARLGRPVALKAQAAALPRKTDAGGVVLGLADAAAVEAGFVRLRADVARARPGLALDGVLVEPMAPDGVELIVGARRDPDWGATLLVGFGGVTTELLHDVVLLPADATEPAIAEAIGRLRLAPLLAGFRGAPVADLPALVRLVAALGRVVTATPAIREVDLNPVRVFPAGKGALALDALILRDGEEDAPG